MKKFYSFALILLTLFSCVVFSACDNVYKDLKMSIFSSEGYALDELDYTIDDKNKGLSVRLNVEFSGIEKEDVGQIVVYSLPNELITVTGYTYNGLKTYVDFIPNMASVDDAKLIVSHLASGKKKSIPLSIEQKSNGLNIVNDKYIVEIPETASVDYHIDFSKVLNLLPYGSTDEIYFKTVGTVNGVEPIYLQGVQWYEDVCVGLTISNTISEDAQLQIYPVTYMVGYEDVRPDQYEDKLITIYFKHILNSDNVSIVEDGDVDFDDIKLIANDKDFSSYTLSLQFDGLTLEKVMDMYDMQTMSEDSRFVSAFVDSNKNVVITANAYTETHIKVRIILSPINYVGDTYPVELSVGVKGELRSDNILVKKNLKEISIADRIDIFNYYSEGNALGSMFTFEATSVLGTVNQDLSKMVILIDPTILSSNNTTDDPVGLNSKLFSLEFYVSDRAENFDGFLNFSEEYGMMISGPISSNSRVYIKYVNGGGTEESSDFGIKIQTINESTLSYWNGTLPTQISVNFNKVEGVKAIEMDAGRYDGNISVSLGEQEGIDDVQEVYLNRSESIVWMYFIDVVNGQVLGIDGQPITTTKMTVTVKAPTGSKNQLKIHKGFIKKVDTVGAGETEFEFVYNSNDSTDVLSLIYDENTSIGKYEVIFSQEGEVKDVVVCYIYEELDELTSEMLEVETNKKAFVNDEYPTFKADYIVAKNQALNISINLPQEVISSNILDSYEFNFNVGDDAVPVYVDTIEKEDYVNKIHDRETDNSALFKFIKGTYINTVPGEEYYGYVYVVICANTYKYDNIIKKSAELDKNFIMVSFYVYEEITGNDISIDHANITRYVQEYLGNYYSDLSKLELNITMRDNLLWNYVTGEERVVWNIDGKNIKYNRDSPDDPDYDYDYYKKDGVTTYSALGTNVCEFVFGLCDGEESYTRVIKAFVQQFGQVFELRCVVNVEKPVLTERIEIVSDVRTHEETLMNYINLENGDEYKVVAKNISSLGKVTNQEIVIQVVDESGSTSLSEDCFEINQDSSTIKVTQIDGFQKFKLIVFAKDVVICNISSEKNYKDPASFILNVVGPDSGRYLSAYAVIDIILSDGSEDNPYLVENSNDFWRIDDDESHRESYYLMMTSISLNNSSEIIENFKGSIRTYENRTYIIEDVKLDNTRLNLFKGFEGDISNVKFVVEYSYKINEVSSDVYLGVFNKNGGKLTNVSVEIRGVEDIVLEGGATYYFGGLVGENLSLIQYTQDIIGVTGSITIKGKATVYFGGLVGKNVNQVEGNEGESSGGTNEIVLIGQNKRSNALSIIEINSELSGGSAIGGAVGLNTYDSYTIGVIKNAFVEAKIEAEETSNVGGVIGKNVQQTNNITIEKDDYDYISYEYSELSDLQTNAIYNVKSSSKIIAKDNLGGIVGQDINGIYYDCDYQILSETNKTISLTGNNNVGGIAGKSEYGKFIFCSVMNYVWDYNKISEFETDVEDIKGVDFVGGIVGLANNNNSGLNSGSNEINQNVVVISSSVNAFMRTGESGNIGGILSSNSVSIIYNAYFIGRLEGNVKPYFGRASQELVIENKVESFYNNVYSLMYNDDGYKSGGVKDSEGITFEQLVGLTGGNVLGEYWWWADNVNGGFIYITKNTSADSEHVPIFDLAPNKITVSVVGEAVGSPLERILRLPYYDFSINENVSENILLTLKQKYNTLDTAALLSKINIVAEPSGLGKVLINVRSTKTSVVDITVDGKLIINGIGECELVFSSVLNPNAGVEAERKIKVIVDYPIGTSFRIQSNQGFLTSTSIEKIAKDSSRQYYIATSGYKSESTYNYYYITKNSTNLEVEISYTTADETFDISQYISVSALAGVSKYVSGVKTLTFKIVESTPFMIMVKEHCEDVVFNVRVTPYRLINGVECKYENELTSDPNDVIQTTFSLSTMIGVTGASFSYDEAVVYPNDTVYLTVTLNTDLPLTNTEINNIINENNTTANIIFDFEKYSDDVSINIYLDKESTYDSDKEIQIIYLRIEFDDMELTGETGFELKIKQFNDLEELATVKYIVIPQRINKIEIKNYFIENDGNKELNDVLKPNNFGEIIIDIVPNNGYYSYLEISDITGDEEILFIQIDEYGNALTLQYNPSSDRKGIRIEDYGLGKSRVYVRTQISNTYSSKIHTIQVRAYSNDGIILAKAEKEIDVKMLPEIKATMLLPDGDDSNIIAGNANNLTKDVKTYIANGVDANIRVETRNSTEEVKISLEGELASNFEFVKDVDNFYILRFTKYDPSFLNKEVKLNLSVQAHLNDTFETAECSITFKVVDFVIHKVSVNHAVKDQINGYFDRNTDLEFYFGKYDISFYDTTTSEDTPFWATEYQYDPNWESRDDSAKKAIYSILNDLNNPTGSSNPYLILNNNTWDVANNRYNSVNNLKITLTKNRLKVEKGYETLSANKYLAVAFRVYYDSGWKVESYDSVIERGVAYVVNKNHYLNFREVTNWYEPTVINTKEDFLNMSSGGNYILNLDLTGNNALESYTPLNVDLVQFDGNGHTIEIKSFATFNETSVQVGLFAEIYEEMIVKNVKVVYNPTRDNVGNYPLGNVTQSDIIYADLSQNSTANIDELNFGGIAAVNGGIITNCVVEGCIAVSASRLDKKAQAMNIGSVVAENKTTGFITNTVSELQIFSLANIAGFVHTNAGKISSCKVGENATIYAYNANIATTIVVEVAGFVVNNSGKISMSCVSLKKGNMLSKHAYVGTMNAKDTSAGFVYSNSGTIFDTYVQMTEEGTNNNRFEKFVNVKGGTIERYYTYIRNVAEFNSQESFAYGDNRSAIWKSNAAQMPTLISIEEFKFDNFAKLNITTKTSYENGVSETTYETNFANYGTKENPYIVHSVETWNTYFNEALASDGSYYRIVSDIDFIIVGGNPSTSTMTFTGNIQGNDMELKNIMLYTNENRDSIGLFESLEGVSNKYVVNSVRNLKLGVTSVWASSTKTVGVLAGIIENFTVYNIEINAENVIMVGANAVGGIAGIVCGEFDMDQITSNIGVNSTRASTLTNYSIYMSKNNKKTARFNLSNVYYAGSVAGILDGYSLSSQNINIDRVLNSSYNYVNNIKVNGNVIITGDTAGAAFGLVGEKVYVKNVSVNISGSVFGEQYSAGLVGENRGVIDTAEVVLADDLFKRSKYVSCGAVGFNLGGLVKNVTVQANIVKKDYFHTVAGIVGRNVYGTIVDSHFDGTLSGYYTGGIIGAHYSVQILKMATAGSGALSLDCLSNVNLIPNTYIKYYQNGVEISNFSNLSIGIDAVKYLVEDSSTYYSYQAIESSDLNVITVKSKVLGLVVGLSDTENNIIDKDGDTYKIKLEQNKIIFNTDEGPYITCQEEHDVVLQEIDSEHSIKFNFGMINSISLNLGKTHVIYLIGANATSFNSWENYTSQYILVK